MTQEMSWQKNTNAAIGKSKPKKKKEPVAPPGALVIKDIKTTIKKKKD